MRTTRRSAKNLFLSHAWQTDARGRSTHAVVRDLRMALGALGRAVWFDEEQLLLGDCIDVELCRGIQESDVVVVCITRAYCDKINTQSQRDSCAKEFRLALSLNKKILPIILERDMLDATQWPPGVMRMYLANTFHLDATDDDTAKVARNMSQMLELLGVTRKRRPSSRWLRSIFAPPADATRKCIRV